MLKKSILILICFFAFQFLSLTLAFSWEGKVVGVSDGDTITVLDADKIQNKIRLYGIDCPEKHQAFGQKAKQFTSDMVFGKSVEIKTVGADKYGRTIAWVNIGGQAGPSLNEELLKAGLAWHYKKYSLDQNLNDFEEHAKTSKLGLWSDPSAIPPWEFRRGKGITTKNPQKIISEKKESSLPRQSPPVYSNEDPTATGRNAENNNKGTFHGNRNSLVFHSSGCRFYNCDSCTTEFKSREEAIRSGYKPCKVCNP